MNCVMCKGTLENKNTTFMIELDNCIIIIKNVPSQVCKQCGEVTYSDEVAKQLEKLVNTVRNSNKLYRKSCLKIIRRDYTKQ